MEKFRHVKPTKEWEEQAVNFIREFREYKSSIVGAGGLNRFVSNEKSDYDAWLLKLEQDRNCQITENTCPTETFFLIRENDNKIVGVINIRLALNESLKKLGGHIGYSIRPTERGKGYNKINLYLGLLFCQEHGVKEIFMDCEKHNVASAKTIQALGGKLINEWFEDDKYHCIIQDYTIDVDEAIEKNRSVYEEFIVENESIKKR